MKAFKGYMEKKTRRDRDLKNLEIANIQMKSTDNQCYDFGLLYDYKPVLMFGTERSNQ